LKPGRGVNIPRTYNNREAENGRRNDNMNTPEEGGASEEETLRGEGKSKSGMESTYQGKDKQGEGM